MTLPDPLALLDVVARTAVVDVARLALVRNRSRRFRTASVIPRSPPESGAGAAGGEAGGPGEGKAPGGG
jgi:hypothetical protein